MRLRRLAPLMLGLFAASVCAQGSNPYDGSWTIKMEGTNRVAYEGDLVIQGEGGSWKVLARDKRDPCIGREAPLVVRTATAEKLVFDVNRSKVLTGCPDWTMKLTPVDDKTLSGQFKDGRVVTFIRQ